MNTDAALGVWLSDRFARHVQGPGFQPQHHTQKTLAPGEMHNKQSKKQTAEWQECYAKYSEHRANNQIFSKY